MERNNQHRAVIDYLRFVAIILIAICHYYTWGGNANHFDFTYMAVEFFPIVSGWLFWDMVQRQGETGLFGYVWKRFKRLFPYTFPALLILLVRQSFICEEPLLKQLIYALPEVFLLNSNGMNLLWGTLNGPSWIIMAMFLAEVALYAMVLTFHKKAMCQFILPLSVLFGYGWWAASVCNGADGGQEAWNGLMNMGFIRTYIAVCLGCLTWFAAKKLTRSSWTKAGAAVLSVLELAAYTACLYLLLACQSDHYNDNSLRYVVTGLLAVGITLSFTGLTWSAKLKDWGLSRYLGKLSLSHCLTHLMIIQLFYKFFEDPWSGLRPVLFLAVSVAWAVIYQLLVDTALNWGKKMAGRLRDVLWVKEPV